MRIRLPLLALLTAGLLVAGCGEETYQTNQNQPTTGGAVTGILMNLQRPDTADTNAAAAETTTSWTVVDPAGSVIFSSLDVKNKVRGVCYAYRRADTEGKSLWLGKNPKEFGILSFEVSVQSEKERTIKFMVSDVTAAEMRAIPNLADLIRNANLVVLTGRSGY